MGKKVTRRAALGISAAAAGSALLGWRAEAMAQPYAGSMSREKRLQLLVGDIIDVVSGHFDMTREEMFGPVRSRQYVRARQTGMSLTHILTHSSYVEIGRWFGMREHTTVLDAVRRAAKRVLTEPDASLETGVLKTRCIRAMKRNGRAPDCDRETEVLAEVVALRAQNPWPLWA